MQRKKKLEVRRDTIKELTTRELEAIQGGDSGASCGTGIALTPQTQGIPKA